MGDNVHPDTFKLINANSKEFGSNSNLLHTNDHYNDTTLFAGMSIENDDLIQVIDKEIETNISDICGDQK